MSPVLDAVSHHYSARRLHRRNKPHLLRRAPAPASLDRHDDLNPFIAMWLTSCWPHVLRRSTQLTRRRFSEAYGCPVMAVGATIFGYALMFAVHPASKTPI